MEAIAVALVLGDVATVVAVPGMTIAGGHSALAIAAVLTVVGAAQAELDKAALRRERVQWNRITTFDFLSVWLFSAAALLPPVLFVPTISVVYFHTWWRISKKRVSLFKVIFNLSKIVVAAYAVRAVVAMAGAGDPVSLIHPGAALSSVVPSWLVAVLGMVPVAVPAIVVFVLIDQSLVIVMMKLAEPKATSAQLLGGWADNFIEIATVGLGALVAVVAVLSPRMLILSPGLLLIVQRAAVARRLQHAQATDDKTGLLTLAEWTHQTRELLAQTYTGWRCLPARLRRLARPSANGSTPTEAAHRVKGLRVGGGSRRRRDDRPGEAIGLFVVDIDHFKQLNSTYGHLDTDKVLQEIARRLRDAVREHDRVGRWGGDEFVVLLRGSRSGPRSHSDRRHTIDVTAERIRRELSAPISIDTPDGPLTVRPVTMSIGAVVLDRGFPSDRLDAALAAADRGLYSAKRAGRDCLRFGELRRVDVAPEDDTMPQIEINLDDAPTEPLPNIPDPATGSYSMRRDQCSPTGDR